MKLFLKTIAVVFGLIGIFFLGAAIFFGPALPEGGGCSPDSAAVQKAKNLTSEELEQLYYLMSELEKDDEIDFKEWDGDRISSLPEPIKKLEPRRVTLYGPRITLEECFDSFVIMWFHGLGGSESKLNDPGIELQWGEHADHGKVYLWKPGA
jgi:hypothetical protein